jgi:TPR repeat protein
MNVIRALVGIALCLCALSGVACDDRVIEPKPVKPDAKALFERAQDLQRSGNVQAAVPIYERAARKGSGEAAYAVADIYAKGTEGVPKNYQKALIWWEKGRQLGMPSLTANCRR